MKNLNIKADFNIIGGVLIILSITLLVPFVVALIYSEPDCVLPFLVLSVFVCIAGIILRIFTSGSKERLNLRDGFFTITSVWILIPFAGAMPYLFTGSIGSFGDALFESYSGFTSTGATIISDVESLPHCILFWRAFTQWLGSFAILALAGALIPWLNRYRQNVTVESTSARDNIDQQAETVAHMICCIYLSFTAAMIILMKVGHNPIFDCICHTFSTVSTGGFSIYNDGMDHFTNHFPRLLTIVFMFLAAFNYNTYIMGLKHGPKTIFKNTEFKAYVVFAFTAAILLFISLSAVFGITEATSGNAVFQTVSFLTTTGFTTTDYLLWPDFSMAVLLLLYFIGGCIGSAGGGIKVFRIVILLKLIKRSITMRLHPNAVAEIHISGRSIASDTVIKTTSFIMLYFVVFIAGSLIISLDNLDFLTTISAVISCLGNIGPGFGLCGPGLTYTCFSGFSKLVLSILMLAGRLELFTFIMVFSPLFWNTNR